MAAAGVPGRLIIGSGKAPVDVVADQKDFGKLLSHRVSRAIGGGIVDNNDFQLDIVDLFAEREQTIPKQVAAIPIDYADGDIDLLPSPPHPCPSPPWGEGYGVRGEGLGVRGGT